MKHSLHEGNWRKYVNLESTIQEVFFEGGRLNQGAWAPCDLEEPSIEVTS